ncbi:MAG: gliding motility-associated C-terminal domain-containing protein [Bacteroidota bacterium]
MSKLYFLLLMGLVVLFLPTYQVLGQCMAEAGTFTVNDDGDGTNPFVVCFGDDIDLTSDDNYTLPPTGPLPAMVYLFYSCPPTGPDPESDPCWTSWFWTGEDIQTVNDGGIVGSVGINTFILVPAVIDNNQPPPNGPNIDSDDDDCYDINPDDTETFTFLNELIFTEIDRDDCTGEVTIEITGGYPELFTSSYLVTNTGPGILSQSGASGEIITISGLMDGDAPSFSLDDDGNGCSGTFDGDPIDQMLELPDLAYPDVCSGSSVLPNVASPGGGDFAFVIPPGDGASIDPFSGEVFDVMDSYEISYTVNVGCAPTTNFFTLTVIPLPPPPIVDPLYEFCPTDAATVSPSGEPGATFNLYEDETGSNLLASGNSFNMDSYLLPGDPETEFWVTQTVGQCESEPVPFSVIIYGEAPPLVDPFFVVCEGEEVTIEPISGNDNPNSDFYFYADASLSSLLFIGISYTFTPTMNTTIYITELNEFCESVAEPVDIILESPPTATLAEPVCYAGNTLYSIVVTTDAVNINPSVGLATNNNDGTFTITDIPSGALVTLILENSDADCNSEIELPEFDCGCAPPEPPISGGNETICEGDPLPSLNATAGVGQEIDWYNAATDGTLLSTGNTFTPPAAGTYYAEARIVADDCVSTTRTAITLTINPVPSVTSTSVACAPDLLSYTVTLELMDAASVNASSGTVTELGGGMFTISSIAVGTDITFTLTGDDSNCTLGPINVTSPSCPCPDIAPPMIDPTLMICPGDPIPTLTVTVDPDLTADWYDAPADGLLLAGNTLSYTPPSTGTYYVEAKGPVNNCVSTRIAVTISNHPTPDYTLLGTSCAADLLTYQVQLTISNADQLMANAGTVMDNGGGAYTVVGIPAGMDLSITVSSSTTTCSITDLITAPDCNCAVVASPISNGDESICAGQPLPTLSVTVNPGETVDWYDAPVGGMQLATNNTSYSPTVAGIYYAETRVLTDGCVSSVRTAVSLTINPQPGFVSADTLCAPDLLSYTLTLTLTDATTMTVNAGTVNDLGGGVFEISGIPTGTDLVYTAFNADMTCDLGPNTIASPVCPCPTVSDPIPAPVSSICPGDPVPALSVTVADGLTADWYDDPVAGTQLASGTLSFTPAIAGTYYVEARDPVNNCVSNRLALTIVVNPDPSYVVNNAVCAADLLTYSVDLQITDGDVLMVNAGTITDNGGGNFTVDGIPAGTDLQLDISNSVTFCAISDQFTSPDCACGSVNPPVSGGDELICTGNPIPALTADPGPGAIVDWYDEATGGMLLATGNTFTPIAAGTYYAETRITVDDCVSFARTAIILTINLTPTVDDVQAACAPDLLTYSVDLITTNGASVNANMGTVINTGAGTFSITDIPAGTDLTYTVFDVTMSCPVGPLMVAAPDCSCPMVNPPVSGGDQSICAGAPIPDLNVLVGNGETADWYDVPTGGTPLAQNTLTFTPPAAGTYFAEARNTTNNCVSERITISFTLNPLPSFVLLDTICSPDLLTYQAILQVNNADELIAGLGTVTDNGGGNFTVDGIPSGLALNFTLNNTTTGCSSTASIAPPDCSCEEVAPPTSTGNVAICTGDPIPTLMASVAADQTVDWYDAAVGGTLLANDTDSFTPVTAGTYFAEARVVVNGCVSLERTAITIVVNPTPVLFGSTTTECAPDLLTYTVTLQINSAATLDVNAGVVSTDGSGNFTITGIPAGMDLIYTAFNTGMTCSLGPNTAVAPDCSCPIITNPTTVGNVSICAGDPLPMLTADVESGLTADWYDDPVAGNLLLTGSTTFTPTAIGTYYVEARDPINNCISERIAVTITENSIPPPMSLGDQSVCEGVPIPELAVLGLPNELISWFDAPIDGNLIATGSSFTPPGAGTYYAEVRSTFNNCASLTRTAVSLTVFENPILSVANVTDPGCNDNDGSVSLSADGGLAPYSFRRGNGELQTDSTFAGLGVDIYTFSTIDDNGCSDSLEQGLEAPNAVTATLEVDAILDCLTEEVNLDATGSTQGNTVIYSWTGPDGQSLPFIGLSATANEAGSYQLVVTDTITACTDQVTITVQADLEPPSAEAGTAPLITCDNESATLTASSNSTANLSFSWQAFEGGMISGSPNLASIVATSGGLYEVLITNLDNGCAATDTVRVEEVINTEIALNIIADDPDCLGDTNGSILLEPADPSSTLLFAPEGEAFSLQNSFFNLAAGSYSFTVQDEFGCEVLTTVTLREGTDLSVDLGEDLTIKLGEVANFEPLILPDPGAIETVKWTPRELLDCDTCLFASTLNDLAYTNDFRLTVQDSLGCTATDNIRVIVLRNGSIYVPSAFSPDDDGINDVLFAQAGSEIEWIESFQVFNRWGEQVFKFSDGPPNDPSIGWDGTHRGEQLNAAVFVYVIEIRFVDGQTTVIGGDVMLLR